jgi:hypothetical protein
MKSDFTSLRLECQTPVSAQVTNPQVFVNASQANVSIRYLAEAAKRNASALLTS